MRRKEVHGGELELARARARAGLGKLPAPDALVADLHGIPFVAGEKVIDTVTGLEVEVVGSGVVQAEAGGAGAVEEL
jgi:hypothetical protein